MPISINAKYNSVKNGKLKNIGLPNNWNLNVNQFLIKNETKNDKTSFTYIDDNGKSQIIEEKYYYTDDNHTKQPIQKEQITVDLDGNLKYNDKEVKTELEAPSGIKLISSIKDFKGSHLVDNEPEELKQVKDNIKQLEENIDELNDSINLNNKQLCIYVLSKIAYEKQLINQTAQIKNNSDYLELYLCRNVQSKILAKNFCYIPPLPLCYSLAFNQLIF